MVDVDFTRAVWFSRSSGTPEPTRLSVRASDAFRISGESAMIDPSIITGQKQLYMDIDIDHGASYGKTIFWDASATVPSYLRPATVQFDIDAEKFYKIFLDLMTRPPGKK